MRSVPRGLKRSLRSTDQESKATTLRRERIMKTLASALIALAVLAGIAAPLTTAAGAFDVKSYFEQQRDILP
jgi:hypothetical protein